MIPPSFQHRFEGDSGIDVGTQEIDAVFPDGQRIRVILRVGAPFQRDGDWLIRSELENLDRTDGPLTSCDSLTALSQGIAWIVGRLAVFRQAHQCQYYWPDSKVIFDAERVFTTSPTFHDQGASGDQHDKL